jgi:hypothetical protein
MHRYLLHKNIIHAQRFLASYTSKNAETTTVYPGGK